MRTTIKDIAKATGLSIATVSLVLNDKPHKIAEATKELIKKTAKEMNYVPNQLARGLVKSKNKILGFIIPDITNMYFAEMAKAVQDEAIKLGYNVILCNADQTNTDKADDRQEKCIKMLCQNGAAGIIAAVNTSRVTDRAIELVEQLDMNLVLIDSSNTRTQVDSIMVNQQYGSYMASSYLIDQGHRKIGCITGPKEADTSKARLRGYQKALEEYEIFFDDDYVYEGNYQIGAGEKGARQLIEKGVTAIYAFNDMMAYGVYKEVTKMGYRIPEDISVMGFDNIPFSSILPIPLTTIEQPIREMGEQAVKRLVEKIEAEKEMHPQCYVFRPKLVIRESVKAL